MRVVPRENEAINETWIADRDRFSYEGIYSEDRLKQPLVRHGAEWVEADWETALMAVAEGLKSRAAALGVLASSSTTLEELYLAQRLARGLGTNNIDHRLRQRDFRDQAADPVFPGLGMPMAEVDTLDALFVVGSHLRREVPILAHRVRKAARRGAQVSFLNPARFTYLFPVKSYLVAAGCGPGGRACRGARRGRAGRRQERAGAPGRHRQRRNRHGRAPRDRPGPAGWREACGVAGCAGRPPCALCRPALARGNPCRSSPAPGSGALPRAAMPPAPILPGRSRIARPAPWRWRSPDSMPAQMLSKALRAYLLVGGIEPSIDALDPESPRTLGGAELVVAITPFASEEMKAVAHVMLPMGTFAETSGTYVNCSGTWQSQAGAAAPVGEARPGWKILRVLGNLLNLPGFEYQSSEEVLEELRERCAHVVPAGYQGTHAVNGGGAADPAATLVDVPMYQVDAVVRRAPSLQRTREGRTAAVVY